MKLIYYENIIKNANIRCSGLLKYISFLRDVFIYALYVYTKYMTGNVEGLITEHC